MSTWTQPALIEAGLHPVKAAALARRISPDWQQQASCAASPEPNAWFPGPRTPLAELAVPLAICAACPVRRACLAAGLRGNEHGIWGGTTEGERQTATEALNAGARVDAVLDQLLASAQSSMVGEVA